MARPGRVAPGVDTRRHCRGSDSRLSAGPRPWHLLNSSDGSDITSTYDINEFRGVRASEYAADDGVVFRRSTPGDGGRMHRVIAEIGVLERNTLYAYTLLADEFGDACVVAERDGEWLGFVLGFRRPRSPDTLFVWQVGVTPAARGLGLGKRLLAACAALGPDDPARWVEATVAPDNEPSKGLFTGFARSHGASCEVASGYQPEHFKPGDHGPEERYRIGALTF